MDSSDSIGVYGEAKAEYTRQLCIFVVPALETYFLDLLAETKVNEKNPQRVLWVFQDSLKQFPEWNVDKVNRETEKVISSAKCDYLEEILTAVFIAHTKVLSAIRLTSKQKKLQITIPKLDHFLHRTMSECARLLWSNAYLFAENGTSIDKQKNLRQVEQLLHEGILQSIRGMLPVKSILKEYLADDGDEAPNANDEDQQNTVPPVIPEAFVQDLSGSGVAAEPIPAISLAAEPEVKAEAPGEPAVKLEPVVKAEPAVKLEPAVKAEPVVRAEAPGEPVVKAEPVVAGPPTIVVDTEPAKVSFTKMDTFFDSQNPNQNSIHEPVINTNTDEEDDDDSGISHLEISNDPPEPMDDYENLEENEALEMDEFETL